MTSHALLSTSPWPKRRTLAIAAWLSATISALAATSLWPSGGPLANTLLLNVTASQPLGVYVRSPHALERGRLVAFHPPNAARGHMDRQGGGAQTFLKRLAGLPGETVCIQAGGLRINQRHIGQIDFADNPRARLPHWSGCRSLNSDEYFVYSSARGSFDSRYYGPIHRSAIVSTYEALLVWRA